ncbi:MAG: DNA mismatch repair protein MutS [Myxococcota bacterium]|nr:DNA mismatch repair protein MutS [Myxococcota bacterium]
MSAQAVESEYQTRLRDRRASATASGARARLLSNARLVVFLAGAVIAWLVFGSRLLEGLWLAPPALAFAALVVAHDRALRRQARDERAVAYYEAGLGRLAHELADRGASGEEFVDSAHPYAQDLDLFGKGSLFQLLCRARTRAGEDRLADWLRAPAAPATARARQPAVRELAGRHDLREALSLVGEEVAADLQEEALVRWGAAAPAAPAAGLRVAAGALAAASSAALTALFLGAPIIPLLAALAVQSGFAATQRGRVQRTLRDLDAPLRRLEVLGELLALLEAERFTAPALAALREKLATAGLPPSRRIARLRRLCDLLDARRNQLFAPIGALLLFTTQIAYAIDAWRARFGAALADWVAVVAELEALTSFATHAFEHPDDVDPEIVEAGPVFEARALGHPLLAEPTCVRNDVRLDPEQQLLLVSGSNMSGKSTLMRAVGVNAVLALAGAPVRARALRIAPVAVGASIRIVDSLQEGASRFYAEITRLRQIVELCDGPLPVLFLLDEILHGTNSHDRRIGAEAVVRGLLARGAIGLVTTHDLALTRVAEALAPQARNVHFQDHLEDGQIQFDYRMQDGVVTKSNALELMRSVGLEI